MGRKKKEVEKPVVKDVKISDLVEKLDMFKTRVLCPMPLAPITVKDKKVYTSNVKNRVTRKCVVDNTLIMGSVDEREICEFKSINVSVPVTREQINDLRDAFGVDMLDMIRGAINNELAVSVSRYIQDILVLESYANNNKLYKHYNNVTGFKAFVLNIKNKFSKTNKSDAIHSVTVSDEQSFNNFLASFPYLHGDGKFIVTNEKVSSMFSDFIEFKPIEPEIITVSVTGNLYLVGTYKGIEIYVNPYMEWKDTRVFIGRNASIALMYPDDKYINYAIVGEETTSLRYEAITEFIVKALPDTEFYVVKF